MEMTSKEALERLNNFISREKHINSERNKTINECINTIKQDLERKEELEKENQELKEDLRLTTIERTNCEDRFYKEHLKRCKLENVIDLLKPILDIYAGEGKGYIDCCVENPIITFDLYNDKEFKLYVLLKEVLGNE